MAVQIKIRQDSAANWSSNNPVLALGEMGWDTTNSGLKIGDGATAWDSLDYFMGDYSQIMPGAGMVKTDGTDFITAVANTDYLPPSGAVLGDSLDANNNKIVNLATPTNSSDAVTKNYVDSVARGLAWQEPVLDSVDFSTDEPASPSQGDRYLDLDSGDIKKWDGSAWVVPVATEDGIATWDESNDQIRVYTGTEWTTIGHVTIPDHNALNGLQGGASGEYYHLTANQHTQIGNALSVEGVLKTVGGVIQQAVAGVDYAAVDHTHEATGGDILSTGIQAGKFLTANGSGGTAWSNMIDGGTASSVY